MLERDCPLFPTPNAALLNDAEEAEDFDARQKKWGDKYYNSPPLEVFVKAPGAPGSSWQTPTGTDARGVPYQLDCHDRTKPRPTLMGEATQWQTPAAAQGLGGHISRGGDRKDEPYLAGQAQQWRTPAGSDGEGGTMEMRPGVDGKYKLRDHAAAWPTPRAGELTGRGAAGRKPGTGGRMLDEEAKNWPMPTQAPDAKNLGSNQVGSVPSLGEAAKQFPTPQAHDAQGGDPERVGRYGTEHGARNLADDVTLFPTPTAMDGNRTGVEEDAEAWRRRQAEKARQGVNLHYHLNAAVDDFGKGLFPTPKTPTGGAESRGSRGSGGEDLEAAVTKEEPWRSPSSGDWKGESAQSWRDRARGQGDPIPTLPDQIRALEDASLSSSPAVPGPPARPGGPRSSPLAPTSLPPSWVRSLLAGKPPADLLEIGRRCAADPSTVVDDTTAIGSICFSLRLFLRRKRLNPRFVEWMMGWPQGWTEHGSIGSDAFASWETASSLILRRLLSSFSTTVWSEEAKEYHRKERAGRITQGRLFDE